MMNHPFSSQNFNVLEEKSHDTTPAFIGGNNVLVSREQHRRIFDTLTTTIAGNPQQNQPQMVYSGMGNPQQYQPQMVYSGMGNPQLYQPQMGYSGSGNTQQYQPQMPQMGYSGAGNTQQYQPQMGYSGYSNPNAVTFTFRGGFPQNGYQQQQQQPQWQCADPMASLNQLQQRNAMDMLNLQQQMGRQQSLSLRFHFDGQTSTTDLSQSSQGRADLKNLAGLLMSRWPYWLQSPQNNENCKKLILKNKTEETTKRSVTDELLQEKKVSFEDGQKSPDESGKKEENGDKKTEEQKPGETQKPGEEHKPGEEQKSEESQNPGEGQKPGEEQKSEEKQQSGEEPKHVETQAHVCCSCCRCNEKKAKCVRKKKNKRGRSSLSLSEDSGSDGCEEDVPDIY